MIDSIGRDLSPIFGNTQVPNQGTTFVHAGLMSDEDDQPSAIRKLLASNITAVIQAEDASAGKGIPKLMAMGIPRGSAGRLVTPTATSWNVDLLEVVARGLNVQPWELLLPDLNPQKGGGVRSVLGLRAKQWPFLRISREELADLSPTEMERLEKTMKSRLEEIRADRAPAPVAKAKAARK